MPTLLSGKKYLLSNKTSGLMEYIVRIKGLSKNYGKVQAVKDVSFDVKKGEFFSLLGPSGCGKTTILRIIGGFIEADKGSVVINEKDMTSVSPNRRNTSMVFQNLALFPHMDVSENIIYGLKKRRVKKDLIGKKLESMLDLVNLKGLGKRRITELSGGQQQRVALARSLIIEPELLLLDEPLASLDKKLRIIMRAELKEIQAKIHTTFLYVTHDQSEALTMSDTIAVMKDGCIIQTGSAKSIYDDPVDRFVADFIGAGNFIDISKIQKKDEAFILITRQGGEIFLENKKPFSDGKVRPPSFFIRPEKVKITSSPVSISPRKNNNIYEGNITKAVFEGPDIRLSIDSPEIGNIIAEVKNDKKYPDLEKGKSICFFWDRSEGKILNR